MKQHGINSVVMLFNQLRLVYNNPVSTEIATKKSKAMEQKGKSFATFLPGFEKTMLEAGGVQWDEQVKKTFLINGYFLTEFAGGFTDCYRSRDQMLEKLYRYTI